MADADSLAGWVPDVGTGVSLPEVVELAFQYRGDVSIDHVDGRTILGYLFNRNAAGAIPFVEVIEAKTGQRSRIPYGEIRNIRFTGRDTAAGLSWEAWRRRRESSSEAG